MSTPTPRQQAAIDARGNTLVMAGAGAGKTSTLVQRCVSLITDEANPVNVDEILMVTFTDAAAAEMRIRIRAALEELVQVAEPDGHLAEQLALMDTANIGTLHSFCMALIREHFHELGLDPQFDILDDADSKTLAAGVLDELFKEYYARRDETAEKVRKLIEVYGRGWDKMIRDFLLKIHRYTQSLADPSGWIADQRSMYESDHPELWQNSLKEVLVSWRDEWKSAIEAMDLYDGAKAEFLGALGSDRDVNADFFRAIVDLSKTAWPRGTKGDDGKKVEKLLKDCAFLASVIDDNAIQSDWNRARPHMLVLLDLVEEFSAKLKETKFQQAVLEFSDLEQLAIELLWKRKDKVPTEVAVTWSRRLKHVFVDEFQDINAAQNQIIKSVSGRGPAGNRFLVGDIKQSIYRFRRADPGIIARASEKWGTSKPGSSVLTLNENFRSHEGVLGFVNELFAFLMRKEVGNVEFDDESRLAFGAPDARSHFVMSDGAEPRVEVQFLKETKGAGNPSSDDANEDLGRAEKEAVLIARRLKRLKDEGYRVWKKHKGREGMHKVDWEDMVILLRSPKSRGEAFAKIFQKEGVPLIADRGGFHDTAEVMDLTHLLMLLDNPLQDVPALTVLRSPLVGLSPNELAALRSTFRKGLIWESVQAQVLRPQELEEVSDELRPVLDSARRKLQVFYERFKEWRILALQGAVSVCLERAVEQTHYLDWLESGDRGLANAANVDRFIGMAREFEERQRQGLYRFLNHLEAQRLAEVDVEPPNLESTGAVRLMSAHRSKGLEFPVVVFGCLSTSFNLDDMRQALLFDERYGLCPRIIGETVPVRYKSVAYWLGERHQRLDTLGEELRLFYVATTRARDLLILTSLEKTIEPKAHKVSRMPVHSLSRAQSLSEWLRAAMATLTGQGDWYEHESGVGKWISWQVTEEADLLASEESDEDESDDPRNESFAGMNYPDRLRRLKFEYPWMFQTKSVAKTSVSELRRLVKKREAEETRQAFRGDNWSSLRASETPDAPQAKHGAAFGTAHHHVMQHLDLSRELNEVSLQEQLKKMVQRKVLNEEQLELIQPGLILGFWDTEAGKEILANPDKAHRELPFTARFTPEELAAVLGGAFETPDTKTRDLGDTLIVQGIVDLVLVGEEAIRIIDFKTDNVSGDALEERARNYHSQIRLYARALTMIYGKPVVDARLCFLTSGEQRQVPLETRSEENEEQTHVG